MMRWDLAALLQRMRLRRFRAEVRGLEAQLREQCSSDPHATRMTVERLAKTYALDEFTVHMVLEEELGLLSGARPEDVWMTRETRD